MYEGGPYTLILWGFFPIPEIPMLTIWVMPHTFLLKPTLSSISGLLIPTGLPEADSQHQGLQETKEAGKVQRVGSK